MANHQDLSPETASATADFRATATSSRWRVVARAAGLLALVSALGACSWSGPGNWRGGGSEGKAEARIERGIDRMFSKVDATDEQKARATRIARDAWAEIAPLRTQWRGSRTQMLDALAAPQVDRGALDALRAARLEDARIAAERMTRAMADIAEVLTPEQRARLREQVPQRWGKGE